MGGAGKARTREMLNAWDLSYRVKGSGKVKRLSLGRVSDVSLEQARDRAHQLTSAARRGVDLLVEEEEAREAKAREITVEQLIERYVARRVTGRLRTSKEIESRLKRALAAITARKVSELRRRDLRELFDAAADEGHEREAEKRRQTTGAMFRWGVSQDLVETDPTAGLKAYDPGRPRDRVLSTDEIEKLWLWLENGSLSTTTADILRMQLLTGARCGEVAGMQVEEIDMVESSGRCPPLVRRMVRSGLRRSWAWPAQSSRPASPGRVAARYSRQKPARR
jgi:integrase